jgi:TPR repeat protein
VIATPLWFPLPNAVSENTLPMPVRNPSAKYYGQAAATGNRGAAFHLGQMFEEGKGVQENYSQALIYYRQAARRGLPVAQIALAELYEKGLGTEVNFVYAYMYYGLAARNDNVSASQHLQSLSRSMTPDQRQQAETLIDQVHQRRIAAQQSQ